MPRSTAQWRITDIASARAVFGSLGRYRREVVGLAYCDGTGRVLGLRHVSGEAHRVELPIRTVAADALAIDAERVVIAHNHPSGDARPTEADLAYTRRLARGLDALSVRLFDHLIVTHGAVTSFRASGLL